MDITIQYNENGEFLSTAKPYAIGETRTSEEVHHSRQEQRMMESELAKGFKKHYEEMKAMFPEAYAKREEILRQETLSKTKAKRDADISWFKNWPKLSQELAAKAPSVRGVRRPHDGPDDYYGTRAEGARFHTHFRPTYPLGTSPVIVLRDFISDCPFLEQYIELCFTYSVDIKTNKQFYKLAVGRLALGLSQTFMENTKELSIFWGYDNGLDALIEVLITSPLAHEDIEEHLLQEYPNMIAFARESIFDPEQRKSHYKSLVSIMMSYFRCSKL